MARYSMGRMSCSSSSWLVFSRNTGKLSSSVTTGLANEMLFEAELDFEWIDLATGETIVKRTGFAASALFTPSRPSQETIDLARFGVVQQLATDLVDALRDDW